MYALNAYVYMCGLMSVEYVVDKNDLGSVGVLLLWARKRSLIPKGKPGEL